MTPPILTLTTDFGGEMGYIGQMKGVILSICPQVQLIDITHDIPPQNLDAAALVLESSTPFFPAGSIHLAVIDPGVGSSREGVAIETSTGVFVGPDNGLFGFLKDVKRIVALKNKSYFYPEISSTFHGRDIFAPVAAHLACGLAIDRLGSPRHSLKTLPEPSVEQDSGDIHGRVIALDRFGNLITDIRLNYDSFDNVSIVITDSYATFKQHCVPLGRTFSEVATGEALAYVGSSKRLEIAVNRGSAAARFGVDVDTEVILHKSLKSKDSSP